VTPQDIPITNPQNVGKVYSNFFGVSATMSDFTIFFLEVGQIPGPNGPIHQQEVKAMVTLPMIAAAGLQEVLQQVIQQQAAATAQQKAKASVKQ
jgi:hypothetical protein